MPSDPLARVDWPQKSEPDELPEWMNEPCTYEELRACSGDLGHVNTPTFGYRPTLAFLQQIVTRSKPAATLRILDVGLGGGDSPHPY